MVRIEVSTAEFRPIVELVVAETLGRLPAAKEGPRLAYNESEAARLLGVRRHVLRDARLRGEVRATRVGKRVAYERGELVAYLARGRMSKCRRPNAEPAARTRLVGEEARRDRLPPLSDGELNSLEVS
jgi:hypothetical protein